MQYARLGDTGLVVSRLSFGAMTFGETGSGPMASIHKVDQSQADAMVGRAVDGGVNFFDTADAYANGQSETMLGKALGRRRRDVVISTKAGFRVGGGLNRAGLSRGHLIGAVEDSLERLGTDYVDVFHVHKLDPYTPMEETLDALDYLVGAGMVRYVGYSNWPAWTSAKAVAIQRERGWARFVSAQMYYSLVGRDLEHEIVPFMKDAGVGLMVWSPLAGGFLSGKYTRESLKDKDNRLSGFDFLPLDKDWGFKVVDKLREIGAGRGASPAQVALAWLLAQPHVSTVLVGATKMQQLDDNLRAGDVKLTAEELAALDELTRPKPIYPNWFTDTTADTKLKEALGPVVV
jgi:aryl-alcohol dehydrogenase-like predicted oxidoreductase